MCDMGVGMRYGCGYECEYGCGCGIMQNWLRKIHFEKKIVSSPKTCIC